MMLLSRSDDSKETQEHLGLTLMDNLHDHEPFDCVGAVTHKEYVEMGRGY